MKHEFGNGNLVRCARCNAGVNEADFTDCPGVCGSPTRVCECGVTFYVGLGATRCNDCTGRTTDDCDDCPTAACGVCATEVC